MTPLGMRGKNLFTATVTVSSLLRFCLKIFSFFFPWGVSYSHEDDEDNNEGYGGDVVLVGGLSKVGGVE